MPVVPESILLEGKEKSLVDHMGCFHGPGLDGVIALLLTLLGLDLSSWESHGKEVGRPSNDEERRRQVRQVQCTRSFFHFCIVCLNGAPGGCARGNPMFLLAHTLTNSYVTVSAWGR